jgi:coenzyme F420-dependent glucose-6-phosphate dehydrogenase
MNEVPVIGVDWPEFRERFRRLSEAVKLIRKLWTEDFVSFDGEYFKTRDLTLYDKPSQPVPIFIAAGGQVAARLAGRAGDGFICTSGKGMELYSETLLPAVREGAQAAGRDPGSIELMIEMKVSFDTTRQRAFEDCRIWAALALAPEEKVGVEDPREIERRAAALPLEKAASRWLVSSDPDEHVEQIRPYLELGFNHLVFHHPGDDQARFVELYGKEVLPRLRKLGY